jgi:transcriptional regulator with XRE-family HTH domain
MTMFELTNFVLEWVIAWYKQMLEEDVFGTEDLLVISADDISRGNLSRYLRGDTDSPDLRKVKLLATGCGVTMSLAIVEEMKRLEAIPVFEDERCLSDRSFQKQQWEHDLRVANQNGKRGSTYRGRKK